MNHTNANTMQESAVEQPEAPNQGALLTAVRGHSIISPPASEPSEAPAVNPHLLTDADVQSFQEGTHCRLQEKLGRIL